MSCFVIMPFSPEFDDVYSNIRNGVLAALPKSNNRCMRLDESRPAGRITDRLLKELHAASLCVADLTGCRPNVMWEVGYAMALQRPTIIITQSLKELPFDIRDMQALEYDRSNLNRTLAQPLQRMIVDTLSPSLASAGFETTDLVSDLKKEIADLREMVHEAVRTWNPDITARNVHSSLDRLQQLEGSWINMESGSHLYAKIIGKQLVAPYCYSGNEHLTGVYYNWQRSGEFWFARYAWLSGGASGFSFLRQESINTLRGAWWNDSSGAEATPSIPPVRDGVAAEWQRQNFAVPLWAQYFWDSVEKNGLPDRIAKPTKK